MKNLILILSFFSLTAFAQSEFKTADQAILKLKSYTPEKIKNAVGEEKDKVEDDLVDDVESAVTFAMKNKVNTDYMKTLVQAASLSLSNDPSIYAAELLVPLYKKDKKSFQEALKSLSKKEAASLEEAVKDKEREEKHGNG